MTQTLGTIGRYELLARLGAGGMGEVFLARATGTSGFEKRVVIKRILPHLADDPEFVRRFIAEGKLVVRLRHAGIAQVLDMGEEGGVTFIAMEYVEGRDLGELMRLARIAAVATPVELVVALVVELLEALDYAHQATDEAGAPLGIIHRDISPANVMIARTGEVKLLDFGIARVTERLSTTTAGAIRGKYSYMSPQQAAGADLDARSDLFSVGVLMWELFAGHRPFDGTSDLLTLDRIRFHDPGPLTAAVPDVPAAVGAVVDRLLAKDPDQRFATADAAMRALLAWSRDAGTVILARDVAAWVDAVISTLPEGLRQRPGVVLSVDDALLLGLKAGGAPGGPNGFNGASAGTTRTVSASDGRPGAAPALTPPAPSAAPSDAATLAAPATGPTPSADPLSALPLDGTPPGGQAIVGPSPVTVTVVPQRARSRVFALLVGLNLLLLVAVGFLVARFALDDELGATPPGDRVAAADTLGAPPPAPESDEPLTDGVTALAPIDPAPDASAAATADSAAPEAPDASPLPTPDATPAPTRAGTVFGALVAELGPTLVPEDAVVTFRATPGGQIFIAGLGTAPSPRHVSARPGTLLRGRAQQDGYSPRPFEVVVGAEEQVHLVLKAIPQGTVTFRFFPANARVLIDDAPIGTDGSNLVTRALAAGPHRLVLVGPDGRKLSKAFDVVEGKTTNLRTLDAEGDGGG